MTYSFRLVARDTITCSIKEKTLDDSRENLKNREKVDSFQSISTTPPHYPTHAGIICVAVVNFCAHGRLEGQSSHGVHGHGQDPFLSAGALPHQPVHGRHGVVLLGVEKLSELGHFVVLAHFPDGWPVGHHLRGLHEAGDSQVC